MITKIEVFFNNKFSVIILILVCCFTIFVANNIYQYETFLSKQDSSNYILLANNLKNYFLVPHQDAMRIFPSFCVFVLSLIGLEIELGFKLLTYIIFTFIHIKLFFILKSLDIKNYLNLSIIAIIIYSNHSVLYSIFNYYQLLDLISYLLILYFIEFVTQKNQKKLFFISLLSIFTKEYLIVLVLFIYFQNFIETGKKNSLINLLVLIFIYFLNYKFAASQNYDLENKSSLISLIKTYVFDLDVYFSSGFNGLIKDKNFLLFFPFSILFFSKKFYKFIFQYYPVLIFSIIPIFFSIFLYNNVGNNFFRVFYHGYFSVVLFSLIFLSKVISEDEKSKVLLFISPFFFIIDFIFILLNINQHGFFEFFQITRYSYLSGYYIFNLTIFIIILFNFKKIFLNK